MPKTKKIKKYDLEQRTEKFAYDCRELVSMLPKTIANIEDEKQLIKSSGLVAINYIQANELFGQKDFVDKIKICRKEVKESKVWLSLVAVENSINGGMREKLKNEARELLKIFCAIILKMEKSEKF